MTLYDENFTLMESYLRFRNLKSGKQIGILCPVRRNNKKKKKNNISHFVAKKNLFHLFLFKYQYQNSN